MKRQLDISRWARKDHFNFFRKFEEPFFGVTIRVDCTNAYAKAKAVNASFFLYYLHKSLVAVNKIEPFRYRISGDDVFVYDQVNASPTINRPDGTFGFAYLDYHERFEIFHKHAAAIIEDVKKSTGLFRLSLVKMLFITRLYPGLILHHFRMHGVFHSTIPSRKSRSAECQKNQKDE